MTAQWRIEQHIPGLNADVYDDLKMFHVELLKSNSKCGLISAYTEPNSDIVHFYDCILASNHVLSLNSHGDYMDLGIGNGLPGIIFGILNKKSKISIFCTEDRKFLFLKGISTLLNLDNIQILNIQPEDVQISTSKIVLCRSYSNLARTLLLGNKVFPKGSVIYSIKGSDWFSELASLPSQICSTWNTEMSLEYELPYGLGSRVILRSTRIS